MTRLKLIGIALSAALAILALSATAASALQWLLNGKPIISPLGFNGSGKVLLANGLGEASFTDTCELVETAKVGPKDHGEITQFGFQSCGLVHGVEGACTADDEQRAQPLNLPWLTLLTDTGGAIGDSISADKGEPGWEITCGSIFVSCPFTTWIPHVVNLSAGVDLDYLGTEGSVCMLTGTVLFENPKGRTLSVSR